jgi:alpha-glucosidase
MRTGLYIMLMLLCKLSVAQDIKLQSPNGKLSANIRLKEDISYSISYAGAPLITKATLALQLRDVNLGAKPKLKRQSITAVKNELRPVVPLKFSKINNEYNLLRMDFGGDYTVEFRAYN